MYLDTYLQKAILLKGQIYSVLIFLPLHALYAVIIWYIGNISIV